MIYLDYAATTPVGPRVLEAMQPFWIEHFGNASSIHQYGQKTRRAIDDARNFFLKTLGGQLAHNIIFTGSGTESCNMAVFGSAWARQDRGKHLIVSAMEHPAVLEAARFLHHYFDFDLTEVKPDKDGLIDPEAIRAELRPDTIFVSVILASNEVGTIQPIKKIAKIVREHGALMHTDACQAPGYTDINAEHLGVDLLSLNSSKIHGPKGVGLLFIREGVHLMPLIHGGGQEFRLRAGTENPALIVGFAKAMELTLNESKAQAQHTQKLRNQLLSKLLEIEGIKLNGHHELRLPNNINIHTPGISGETLVQRLDMEGLAASSGSACSSGKIEPSPTLLAMGQSPEHAKQSLRLTLGRLTTEEEIKEATQILTRVITELSANS